MTVAPSFGEVYLLTNLVNGKMYVGQTTVGVSKRWQLHVRCARSKNTPAYNNALSRAIRKYGPDAFDQQLLSYAFSQAELDNLEKLWICLLQSRGENGYNLTTGGDSGTAGHTVSAETRARLSQKAKEQWKNPEYLQKHHAGMLASHRIGHVMPPQTRAALRMANFGKHQSAETIEKRIKSATGRKRTPEQRARMSVAHLGLKLSSETRLKMSLAQKARQSRKGERNHVS